MYLHDDRSARFCAWRRRIGGALPVTRFGRAEIVNSLYQAVYRKLIALRAAQAAIAYLDEDISQGRLVLIDVLWRRTLDLTAELSAQHTALLGTRTLDVLHIATAITLEVKRFVSYDERQAALAAAIGLRTLAP